MESGTAAAQAWERGPVYSSAGRRGGALDLLGIPVDPVGPSQIFDYMANVIEGDRQATVLHLNVHGANLAARQPWLKDFYNHAQMVFCDGDGIRWGLRILGCDAPPKTTYNEFLWQIARWCTERDYSLFLLGSKPGIADKAADNLMQAYPGLRIAGTHHGYFAKEGPETEAVIREIERTRPDVLLVCLGMPVQERWVAANASRLAAHILMTGGAAIDYGARLVPMAPNWMKRLQMEWLFRLALEPTRMFSRYVIGNPRFIARVMIGRARRNAVVRRLVNASSFWL